MGKHGKTYSKKCIIIRIQEKPGNDLKSFYVREQCIKELKNISKDIDSAVSMKVFKNQKFSLKACKKIKSYDENGYQIEILFVLKSFKVNYVRS